jgi:ABC-2 type transport system permease protein
MFSFIPLLAITRREMHRILRVWSQTLIPPIITSTLYILIFGYSLGSKITDVSGVTYLEFIIPGLLMMGVIMSAYMNTSTSLFISKWSKMVQEWLVAPIPYWQIVISLTFAAIFRAILVGLGVLLISLLFTSIQIHSYFILIYFMLMTSLLFAFAGITTGLWATNFDKMNVFSTFLITPLTYLGGVFYSIKMLPPFWANIAKFNPILYMVDGFRYSFIGVSDVPLIHSMILVFVLATFFFILSIHLFKIGYKLRN